MGPRLCAARRPGRGDRRLTDKIFPILAGLALTFTGGAGLRAQPAPAALATAPAWANDADRVEHIASGISFPSALPGMAFAGTESASHPGSGLDEVVTWKADANGGVAVASLFAPSLPDSGILAEMADLATHQQVGITATIAEDKLLPAGPVANAVRTYIYANARISGHPVWTAMAIVRAGNWVVVLRVTGNPDQATALRASFDALVAGLRFTGPAQPRPFHTLQLKDCPAPTAPDAKALPQPSAADLTAALTLTTTLDSGVAKPGTAKERAIPAVATRVPDALCRMTLDTNHGRKPLFWASDPRPDLPGAQIAALLVESDSGLIIEVQRPAKPGAPYLLIGHNIGVTALLTALDAPLSVAQYTAMAEGRLSFGRPMQGATYDASGKIVIHGVAPPATPK